MPAARRPRAAATIRLLTFRSPADTCDCPDCPDCAKNKRCGICTGYCPACRDPSPADCEARLARQKAAFAARPGPPCGNTRGPPGVGDPAAARPGGGRVAVGAGAHRYTVDVATAHAAAAAAARAIENALRLPIAPRRPLLAGGGGALRLPGAAAAAAAAGAGAAAPAGMRPLPPMVPRPQPRGMMALLASKLGKR